MGLIGDQLGVSIGPAVGGELGANGSVATGPVIDDDGLTESFTQFGRHRADQGVRAPTGRVGH